MTACRLDRQHVTLLLDQQGGGLPSVVHWGAKLPPDEDAGSLRRAGEGLLADRSHSRAMARAAQDYVAGEAGATDRIVGAIGRYLPAPAAAR